MISWPTKLAIAGLAMASIFGAASAESAMISMKTWDGYDIAGKLDEPPDGSKPSAVVVYLPGTGPNTYDNHRELYGKSFDVYDLFGAELTRRGLAFFRCNTRGTVRGDQPPEFQATDPAIAATDLPMNRVMDVEMVVGELLRRPELAGAKVFLLGQSEGTIIAPLVAERRKVPVDALFLTGYVNERIPDVISWQLSGASSMVFFRSYFDADKDGFVSRAEYESGPAGIRSSLGVDFAALDAKGDGKLSAEDFELSLKEPREAILSAIDRGDDDWLWAHYFKITSAWVREHGKLAPNKETIPRLDIPVWIFHGEADGNVPSSGALDLAERAREAGKSNIHVSIFPRHDHDLNYLLYPLTGVVPDGLKALFDAIGAEASAGRS